MLSEFYENETLDDVGGYACSKNRGKGGRRINNSKLWQAKFNHRSARYTTNWNELVEVV
jgi:hypothetical protein